MKTTVLGVIDGLSPPDLVAILGVLLVAIGIELRLGVDIAIGFLGVALVLAYVLHAIATRNETTT